MYENRLEGLKEELDLKSKDVAKIMGVNESTYSEWEHNKIPIPTRRLIQFADFYKVNIDYILKLTDKKVNINKETELDLKLIGERIKETRNKLNLSLRALGEKINCSFSAIASYDAGKN